MKIALCTQPLNTASRTRGVGAYTRELLQALRRQFPQDTILEVSHHPYQSDADLVHYPFFDPFFLTLPLSFPQPTVITIHDLIPLKYPTHFPVGYRGRLKWYFQRLRARHSRAILTDSVSSSADIQSLLRVPASQVTVIPLAPATARTSYTLSPKLKKLYSLPDRYILYVGDVNWNKNLPGLIRAFGQLTDPRTHLVLVGKVFADKPRIPEFLAVEQAIIESGQSSRIHLLGYLPSHHLGAIYHEATLYCQPSFDEGFGLPVLEAMKAGCPVVSSNRGSLPEVGGEAARYFDPEQDDLSGILAELLGSHRQRAEMITQGLHQAKKFSWTKAAIATHTVYEKILSHSR